MKSITECLDTSNDAQLWVQVSDGGNVTISFDTKNSGAQLNGLTMGDLTKFRYLIEGVIEERVKQLHEETNATARRRPDENQTPN